MIYKSHVVVLQVHSFTSMPHALCIQRVLHAGFDRLMAVLCGAKSLREVLAFPKSFLGKDLLTGAPSSVTPQELATYHINTTSHSHSQ